MIKQEQIIYMGTMIYWIILGYMDSMISLIILLVLFKKYMGNHGVTVNSKRIEMFLRQMINTVGISDPGNSSLMIGCCYD